MLHVTSLSTHWRRELAALSDSPDNNSRSEPTSIFQRSFLIHPAAPARESDLNIADPPNQPLALVNNSTPSIQKKSHWELQTNCAYTRDLCSWWRHVELIEGPPHRFNTSFSSGRNYRGDEVLFSCADVQSHQQHTGNGSFTTEVVACRNPWIHRPLLKLGRISTWLASLLFSVSFQSKGSVGGNGLTRWRTAGFSGTKRLLVDATLNE